jgi:hypothetical protein
MTTITTKAERIAAARLHKAQKLVAAIRAAGGTVEHMDLPTFPWEAAVSAAGVRWPSDDTKTLVRETLQFLEDQDRRRGPDYDPFDGII